MPWSKMTPGPRRLTLGVLLLVSLASIVCISRPVLELPQKVGRNNNEGWNAHHTTAFVNGQPLYPGPDELISTTYPPLSFLLVGALAGRTGDALLVGRAISLMGLLVTALCVGWIVQILTRSRSMAWFSGVLAVGAMGAHYQSYVAMNDPQYLGHAVQYVGLGLFLSRGHRRGPLIASALLLLAGGLVKHNLIPVPLGVGLWLWIRRRRDFVPWLLTAVASTILAVAAMAAAFGSAIFASILGQSRTYDVYLLLKALQRWLVPITPMMMGGLAVLFLPRRDVRTELVCWIAAFSLVLAIALSLTEGMAVNAAFDFILALATLCGVAIYGVAGSMPAAEDHERAWIIPLAMIMISLNVALMTPWRAYETYEAVCDGDERRQAAREDIAFVEGRPGPAMCEDPAISYWAKKPFVVDFFEISQRVRSGRLVDAELARRIMGHQFAVIQLDREGGSDLLSDAANAAILDEYELARTSPVNGYFYVPRGSSPLSRSLQP